MAERKTGMRKVRCQTCENTMEIDANSLSGFCWECVGNGKYTAFMHKRRIEKEAEKRAKGLEEELPPV